MKLPTNHCNPPPHLNGFTLTMDAHETVNIQHVQTNFKGKMIANRAAFPYIFFVMNMSIVIYGSYKLFRTFSEVESKDREKKEREEMEANQT